jgi:Skp family chaperone for outer membrane proteins
MRENGTVKRTVVFAAGVLALGLAGYFGSHLRAQQAGGAGAPAYAEPRTRIALLNLAYVIKNYKKTETFQGEIKAEIKLYEKRLQEKQALAEQTAKHGNEPTTPQTQKEADAAELVKLKREIEDLNNEAKKVFAKKGDEQMVILYREIQDAAQRYAMAHNFDLVLHYIDATTQQDYYSSSSIARKLGTPACMPMYQAPGLDISREVVMALNASYARTAPQPGQPGSTHPSGN